MSGPNGWEQTEPVSRRRGSIRWKGPLVYFILTWLSTTFIGQMYSGGGFWSGLYFSLPLMTILTCHELGHYIQTRRYGVFSTLPYFIPVPIPPFGTFGAFIKMDARIPNRKALFDIGISGPLAGLVPTLIFLLIGIARSSIEPLTASGGLLFGEPLLFRWVSELFFDRSVPGTDLMLDPVAMAAWTGLFITSLNLIPLGQLDGGHVFYALLGKKAAPVSRLIFGGILAAVLLLGQWQWTVMVILLLLIGITHPPTANDRVKLGRGRTLIGWLTLAFLIIGFTPNPVSEIEPEKQKIPNLPPMYAAENGNFSIELPLEYGLLRIEQMPIEQMPIEQMPIEQTRTEQTPAE